MSGSLAQAAGYVTDAFKIFAEATFRPEDIGVGEFTFLPWVRNGLAAQLTPPSGNALRATVAVSVKVQDENGNSKPVQKQLTLRGPGDVIGIDSAQIVRRVPRAGTVNAEESFLVHVEFDRPELPWLFTPLRPSNDRLQPWLVLVVCDAKVTQLEPGPPGFPQRLRTRLGELQPLDNCWAFAHAQVAGPRDSELAKPGDPTVAVRLSETFGPTNLSRIVCPRKLDPHHTWIAALVPSFDCGVKAGLGASGGTLGLAWTRAANGSDSDNEILLPVYDTWTFSTADAGDFESMAKKIHPVVAPWNVGKRILDASDPRGNLPALGANDPGRLQVLKCALVSKAPAPANTPPENSAWSAAMRDKLRVEVDRAGSAPNAVALPRVGPRLYARYQRGQATTGAVFNDPARNPDLDWYQQLNTTPSHRVIAGLGTRVVHKDQEQLMQAAWAQVGEIRAVNEALVRIQFGRYVGESLHKQVLSRLPLGELSQVMRGLQDKVRIGSGALTVYGTVRQSAVAPAAMTAAYRRATSMRGPVTRATNAGNTAGLSQMVASGTTFKDFRRNYSEPDGIKTLSPGAINGLSPDSIARTLGVDPAAAKQALTGRLAAAGATPTMTDRMFAPVSSWKIPAGNIDLGALAAAKVNERVAAALPDRLAGDVVRVDTVAPLLAGLANSSAPAVAKTATDRITVINNKLPILSTPPVTPVVTRPPITGLPGGIITPVQPATGIRVLGPTALAAAAAVTPPRINVPAIGTIATGPVVTGPITAGPIVTGPINIPAPPATQPSPVLRFETASSRAITQIVNTGRQVGYQNVAAAASQLAVDTGIFALPVTPSRPGLNLTAAGLLSSVAPGLTVTKYAKSRLTQIPDWLAADWFDDLRVTPIMAAPRMDRPMYEALDAYDRDWLIPGLGSIPYTDFITVLFTNPAFTEAFLVGLSDEMGRELLWRGYPTDERGTYFSRFWNPGKDDLANPIHRFSRAPLGAHVTEGGGDSGHVVMVVRGELVRRYPDLIAVAMRAHDVNAQGKPTFFDLNAFPDTIAPVLFHDHLDPDILLVGFNLTQAQVLDPNAKWWFILAEHPTAPRFGLDLPSPNNDPKTNPPSRNSLDWTDLGPLAQSRFINPAAKSLVTRDPTSHPSDVTWPKHAAVVARTLLQNPIRAAFDARKLLSPILS